MEKNIRDAGFTNVVNKTFKIPYGTWPKDKRLKDLGAYTALYLEVSLDGFATFPIGELMGWSSEEVHVLVAKMRAAIRNPKNLVNGDM
jgi:hypothetical protein